VSAFGSVQQTKVRTGGNFSIDCRSCPT